MPTNHRTTKISNSKTCQVIQEKRKAERGRLEKREEGKRKREKRGDEGESDGEGERREKEKRR